MTALEWLIVLVPYALATACVVSDAVDLFWRNDD